MGSRSEKLSSSPLPLSVPATTGKVPGAFSGVPHFPQTRPSPQPSQQSPRTVQMSPSHVHLTSRAIPDSSPAHPSSFPQLCSMPSVSSPPQLLSPPDTSTPSPRPCFLASTQSTISGSSPASSNLASFSILYMGLAQLSPFTPISSPQLLPQPCTLYSSPLPSRPTRAPAGKRRGLLLPWRPQSSGAAAPSGRGGKCNPTGLPSQLVPYWEWTTIAACQLLLRLDLGGFLDSCFLGVRKVQPPHCDPEVKFEKFCWGRGIQRLRCPIGSVPRLCLKSGPFSPAPCSRPPSPLTWIDCGIHLPSLLAPSQILPRPEGSCEHISQGKTLLCLEPSIAPR